MGRAQRLKLHRRKLRKGQAAYHNYLQAEAEKALTLGELYDREVGRCEIAGRTPPELDQYRAFLSLNGCTFATPVDDTDPRSLKVLKYT